jgi:hypothetical protein
MSRLDRSEDHKDIPAARQANKHAQKPEAASVEQTRRTPDTVQSHQEQKKSGTVQAEQPENATESQDAEPHLPSPVRWPAPLTHVSVAEPPQAQYTPVDSVQKDFSAPAPPLRFNSPRELRVKVWGSEESASEDSSIEEPAASEKKAIEDLPTREMAAVPEQKAHKESIEDLPTREMTAVLEQKASKEAIEDLPTRQLAAAATDRSNSRNAASVSPAGSVREVRDRPSSEKSSPGAFASAAYAPAPASSARTEQARPRMQSSPAHEPFIKGRGDGSGAPAQERRQAVPAMIAAPPVQRFPRSSPMIIVVSLIFLLLLGGGVSWIYIFRPFSISPVTQPVQPFSNAKLGISLSYPSGWLVQVESEKSTVHFYDSSQTAEVSITVGDAHSSNQAQYLQQQATQLGMTGAKAATALSFGGASWQRIQGGVLLKGANYTATILTTMYGNRQYTLVQLAHQSVYTEEEKIVFAPLRASLRFL